MANIETLLLIAPNTSMRTICLSIARDFETLRQSVKFPFEEQNFSENFKKFVEPLHYSPLFDFIKRPYARSNTRAALFVAATGYLSLPLSISNEGLEFGIRLCSHLYFTQPPVMIMTQLCNKILKNVLIAEGNNNNNDDDDDDVEQDKAQKEEVDEDDQLLLVRFANLNRNSTKKGEHSSSSSSSSSSESEDSDNEDSAKNGRKNNKKKSSSQNKNLHPEFEYFTDQERVDRLAQIPISIDTVLQILNLCNNSNQLSDEAVQHFKFLKENNAFAIVPSGSGGNRGIRYADVGSWAVLMASSNSTTRPLMNSNKEESGVLNEFLIKKRDENFSDFLLMMTKKNDISQQEIQESSIVNMDLDSALAEYEKMKVEFGCEEVFTAANVDVDDGENPVGHDGATANILQDDEVSSEEEENGDGNYGDW